MRVYGLGLRIEEVVLRKFTVRSQEGCLLGLRGLGSIPGCGNLLFPLVFSAHKGS